jgi:RHH-type transcriptional regulator, rel operon repressor / antitoxin RelB
VVLGVRLDAVLTEKLDRFATVSRRSKSDIARDAVREYLERHDIDDDYRRQVQAIAAATRERDLLWLDAVHDDLMAGEPDYDWSGSPQ